jgi:cyclic beta-1,2-glucan synthetase
LVIPLVEPCIPAEWDSYKMYYRYRDTLYQIMVTQVHDVDTKSGIILDGLETQGDFILLIDDQQKHYVEVRYTPSS